jgi:2-keto-4-pentenoate hydratase/2-oxohepta-3-ene-1,7-dioic acid hydratase in catechol pathway
MRLCTFNDAGVSRIGRVDDVTVTPLDAPDLVAVALGAGAAELGPPVPLGAVSLLAPLRPGKILGIGKNYSDHAAELGEPVPEIPLVFTKLVTSVTGPDGPVVRPAYTTKLDYEGELAVVIGRTARAVSVAAALDHVAGYTAIDDISARDCQKAEPQWTRAKGGDTFAPMGPWLVTPDELGDPQQLSIRTWVNGELRQDGHTSQMMRSVAELISWCSHSFTLEPGDVIATGTPAGVAQGMNPPRYLEPGDVVRIEVERIGAMEHPIR